MFNRLKNNRAYLCGPMEMCPDYGEDWRIMIKESLTDLGILWLDPTSKPIDIGFEDKLGRESRKNLKKLGLFDEVAREMRIIRGIDLRMVDIVDFLVVNIDLNIYTCGSGEEYFWANRCKKPIICRVAQGKQACPDWLLGTVPHEMIFSEWSEVCDYLRMVNSAKTVDSLNRWLFFDWMGT